MNVLRDPNPKEGNFDFSRSHEKEEQKTDNIYEKKNKKEEKRKTKKFQVGMQSNGPGSMGR